MTAPVAVTSVIRTVRRTFRAYRGLCGNLLGNGDVVGRGTAHSRVVFRFARAFSSIEDVPRMDEFELVAYAASLLCTTQPRQPLSAVAVSAPASWALGSGLSTTTPNFASDIGAWQMVSNRAVEVMDVTNSLGGLVWILDSIARSELHPSQRRDLSFPRLFWDIVTRNNDSLDRISDDELCVAWQSLERLQLLDKQASLLFYRAATTRIQGSSFVVSKAGKENIRPRRCSRFTLRNWVRTASALRGFQEHHPLYMDFVEAAALRLLVERSGELLRRGMQLEALQAVSSMTRLSSRQVHRITAAVHELLPTLQPAGVARTPKLCARAELADEALFDAVVNRLGAVMGALQPNELRAVWKELLRWRVGPPGLRRCAAVLVSESAMLKWTSRLPPLASIQLLRAFGRVDTTSLRVAAPLSGDDGSQEEVQEAFSGALASVLSMLPVRSLDTGELLVATNALGQIARAWSWLDPEGVALIRNQRQRVKAIEQMARRARHLGALLRWQFALSDARVAAGTTTCYSARDLALLVLAHARLARRMPEVDIAPLAAELCARLTSAAATATATSFVEVSAAVCGGESIEVFNDTRDHASSVGTTSAATAALSACAMLLSHVYLSCDSAVRTELASRVIQCIVAWFPHAAESASDLEVATSFHKVTAALAATLVMKLGAGENMSSPAVQLGASLLPRLLNAVLFVPQVAESDTLALFESWHLDGCLHGLAVCEGLGLDTDASSGLVWETAMEAVVAEAGRRRSTLTERSVRFWLAKLCDPMLIEAGRTRLLRHLVDELLRPQASTELGEGEELHVAPGVVAALRDMSFILEEVERPLE
eukprot:TRINITY_DN4076_c1_g2_i1.p1 TRINITY_DN4076_c1_g2~~TRINITY_DN4076_c1_g2_i1.p1  ORF type:complete len:828 (-),score=129.64 TRINITY_DN4076_c1_g2_i1:20-2503(-)